MGVAMLLKRGSNARLAKPRAIGWKLAYVHVCARGVPPDFARVAFDTGLID